MGMSRHLRGKAAGATRFHSVPAIALAAVLAISPLLAATPASAQSRCVVTDPTGTPLNVRDAPNGRKVGTLPNGLRVSIARVARDNRGRAWALVVPSDTGVVEGWVFREFISCY